MMNRKCVMLIVLLGLWQTPALQGQEPIFSGPQVGEKLPPLPVKGLRGQWSGKNFDALAEIQDRPSLIIFFHSLTRPAFGMTRALTKFANSKHASGLRTVVVFLTNDPTKTEKWSENLRGQMPDGPIYCLSPEGDEGPGSYGLNRNVVLTILVAKEGVVTANSALAQPQLATDGTKILQAIVDATGGGTVPSIAELEQSEPAMARRMRAANPAKSEPEKSEPKKSEPAKSESENPK